MTRLLVDTDVFVYARGGPHHYREPCRAALRAAGQGTLVLHASIELLGELTHLLLRRSGDRDAALAEVAEVRSLCRLHDVTPEVWDRAAALLERHDRIGVRDAVHAATAGASGLHRILSTDGAFDVVPEVQRVDPATMRV